MWILGLKWLILESYYVEDITRWHKDMDFTFEWQYNIL